jgi:zinc transport system permease protein
MIGPEREGGAMIGEALSCAFFQRALLAGLLAGLTCGVVGSLVLVKRMSSVSGGLAHASFGGVGFGYLVGIDPLLGAVGFAVGTGAGLAYAYEKWRDSLDLLISIVWATGMSLGIIFVAMRPGYAPNLIGYLFGGILFVPPEYLLWVAVLDVGIVATVALLFKELQAITFDEEFAALRGLPVRALTTLLLVLIALAVVSMIRVVGVILAIALFALPAATARQWVDTLPSMMVAACLLAIACTAGGLFASFALSQGAGLNVPTGPLIVLLAALVHGVSRLLRRGRPTLGDRPLE